MNGNREIFRQKILKEMETLKDEENELIKQTIKNAQMSDHWGCSGNGAIFGEADSFETFVTLAFHETAHRVLGVGCSLSEEEQCHGFSRRVSQQLNLPYSTTIENCCRQFRKAVSYGLTEEEFEREIGGITAETRWILRF